MGPMGAGVRVGARSWRAMEDRLGAAGEWGCLTGVQLTEHQA